MLRLQSDSHPPSYPCVTKCFKTRVQCNRKKKSLIKLVNIIITHTVICLHQYHWYDLNESISMKANEYQ